MDLVPSSDREGSSSVGVSGSELPLRVPSCATRPSCCSMRPPHLLMQSLSVWCRMPSTSCCKVVRPSSSHTVCRPSAMQTEFSSLIRGASLRRVATTNYLPMKTDCTTILHGCNSRKKCRLDGRASAQAVRMKHTLVLPVQFQKVCSSPQMSRFALTTLSVLMSGQQPLRSSILKPTSGSCWTFIGPTEWCWVGGVMSYLQRITRGSYW